VPTITTQPASQSVTLGNDATFTVVATGSGTLTYQWWNATLASSISGATSATYTFSPTFDENGHGFYVVVTDSGGNVTSSTATLTVTEGEGDPGEGGGDPPPDPPSGPPEPPAGDDDPLWAYVRLLIQGSFTDQSDEAQTVTANGSPSYTEYNLSPSLNALVFTGTEYLEVADAASLSPGSDDFCYEMWAKFPDGNSTSVGVMLQHGLLTNLFSGTPAAFQFSRGIGGIYWYGSTDGSTTDVPVVDSQLATDFYATQDTDWHHFAVTRSGDLFSWWFDGELVSSATLSVTLHNPSAALTIGAGSGGAAGTSFHTSDVRLTIGHPRYTSAFTPSQFFPNQDPGAPVAYVAAPSVLAGAQADVDGPAVLAGVNPVVNDPDFSSVLVLQHFDGSYAQIVDTIALTQVNAPTTSDSVYRWGTGSAVVTSGQYQDGVGFPWTADFTVEGWARVEAPAAGTFYILDTRDEPGDQTGFALRVADDAAVEFLYYSGLSGWNVLSAGTVPDAEFFHYMLVRNGDTISVAINGVVGATETRTWEISATRCRFGGDSSGSSNDGYLDDLRVSNIARDIALPAAPYPDTENLVLALSMYSAAPSPLGTPQAFGQTWAAWAAATSLLVAPAVQIENDFTELLTGEINEYFLRVLGDTDLDIPISSWQATLQQGRASYVQCVIPAYADYVDAIADRIGVEDFVVIRRAQASFGEATASMATAPLDQVQVASGPFASTATISGYSDEFRTSGASGTRSLSGVRQTSVSQSGASRARADIDWFLRPGQTVIADGLTFVADYINYYVPADGDRYMDVGSRGNG